MKKTKITWLNSTLSALYHLNGEAKLSDIYNKVAAIRYQQGLPMPKNWKAIIRKTLEVNSSDSEAFENKHDLFKSTDGLGEGKWSVR